MLALQLETREVLVDRTNDHGVRTSDGDWLNLSKFAKPEDVVLPPVGATVRLHLDRAGYVRKIEPLVAAPATPAAAVATVTTPALSAPAIEPATPRALWDAQDARGKVILRESVLNTATAILASGGRAADPAEVLTLAERLEAWVVRA
jgi:hypothetical protein